MIRAALYAMVYNSRADWGTQEEQEVWHSPDCEGYESVEQQSRQEREEKTLGRDVGGPSGLGCRLGGAHTPALPTSAAAAEGHTIRGD